MTPPELLTLFRAEVDDTVAPYLWSDADAYAYMNQAQDEFARMQGGIADSTMTLDAAEGEATAEYSAKILKFRRAQRSSDFRKIDILNVEDLDNIVTDDYGTPLRYSLDDRVGPVRAMVIGMDELSVRWIDIPDADETVQLLVDRLPLEPLDEDSDAFEIRDEYQLDLLHGMKWRAYLKQDPETFDRAKSQEFFELFREAADAARRAQEKRRHKPRAVVYGGL